VKMVLETLDSKQRHTFNKFASHLIPKGQKVVGGYHQPQAEILTAFFQNSAATSPRQAKQAFVLASIEQLVPVLSDKCIRDWVWGVCYP